MNSLMRWGEQDERPFLLMKLLDKVTSVNISRTASPVVMFLTPAGSGDSSVVRAPHSWSKGCGFKSLLERQENFFSRVNFLCWLLFWYPFHPHVTAVARKRPRSFCQKRRWQVTAKHAYTLHMWLCMKWHGAWLYGVHRMRWDWLSLAADSCGTSHASAVSTPLRWIFKNVL